MSAPQPVSAVALRGRPSARPAGRMRARRLCPVCVIAGVCGGRRALPCTIRAWGAAPPGPASGCCVLRWRCAALWGPCRGRLRAPVRAPRPVGWPGAGAALCALADDGGQVLHIPSTLTRARSSPMPAGQGSPANPARRAGPLRLRASDPTAAPRSGCGVAVKRWQNAGIDTPARAHPPARAHARTRAHTRARARA